MGTTSGQIHPAGEHPGFGRFSIFTIARIVYEANRAYCDQNDDHSFEPWDKSQAWQRQAIIEGILAVQANPAITPEQSHDKWIATKVRDGWKYGPEKNAEAKTHPCMVPYHELPEMQKVKDRLFLAIVTALA